MTIYDDLNRRDFTINSIAVNIKTGKVIDPFNGIEDINNKILKATNKSSFVEDSLRIIRAIQFASRFNFSIERTTLELMRSNADLIKGISGERILDEFNKILTKHGSTKVALELLEKSNLDKALFNQKFTIKDFNYFDNLDIVSFYYVLGILGDKTPSKFYRERLRGEANIIKALETLEKHFDVLEGKPEAELKWTIFLMLKSSPVLKDAKIITQDASKVIKDMKAGKIPMKLGDIPVNGNDIMNKFGIKDEELGNIISKMYQDALMNKFDWKNKDKTLKYLENI